MTGNFFSPGKLLLTSEYVVLDGALALALPTKLGQDFFSEEINEKDFTIIGTECFSGKLKLGHQDAVRALNTILINNENYSKKYENNKH